MKPGESGRAPQAESNLIEEVEDPRRPGVVASRLTPEGHQALQMIVEGRIKFTKSALVLMRLALAELVYHRGRSEGLREWAEDPTPDPDMHDLERRLEEVDMYANVATGEEPT